MEPKPKMGGIWKIGKLIAQQVTPTLPKLIEKGPSVGKRTLGICGGPIGPKLIHPI
jgi:hypothetical protein